jgi:hypothetical protein
MPNRNSVHAFIGPRLYTRRQLLKSFGAGAITLSAGYLQACKAEQPNPQAKRGRGDHHGERPNPEGKRRRGAHHGDDHGDRGGHKALQAVVGDVMGNKAASYFGKQVKDPAVIGYIERRASSFGSACNLGNAPGGFNLKIIASDPLEPLDIGGEFTNDLSYVAGVDVKGSSAFAKYFSGETGRQVKKGNVSAFFVTNRFFDAKASNVNGQPLVGVADAVVVVFVTDISKDKKRSTIESYLVDCGGVHLLRKIRFNRNMAPRTSPIEKNPYVVDRDSRVNGYFGNLVADYTNPSRETRKVLLPYDYSAFEDPLPPDAPRRKSYAGIEGVQYQRVDPDIPPEEYEEPSGSNDTGGPSTQTGEWSNKDPEFGIGLAVQGYALDGGQISQPWPPPEQPPGTGYGPPQGGVAFDCFEKETRDNCTGCCRNTALASQGGILAGVGECIAVNGLRPCWVVPIIGNISCVFACCAAGAALSVAVRYKEMQCNENCYKPTPLPR